MEALDSWKEEKRSAYLYRALSQMEKNPTHKIMFSDLSGLAEKQANIWELKLKEAGVATPSFKPDMHAKVIIWMVSRFGAPAMRIALAAMKIRGMSVYLGPVAGHPMPKSMDDVENHHGNMGKGNNLRAAVFGVNDGLISNASLILGVAGASGVNPQIILISGVAGLLAGACSMAAGEYISVKSQREMLEYQLALEKSELELYPEEEAAELALIYQARGIPKEEAEKISHLLIQNPEKALGTLAREELGIDPDDLMSPWGAAISSFVAFGLGATIPLIPFFIGGSAASLTLTIALAASALFIVGAVMSLFTQRSAILSGLRMMFIGALAGTLTYFIGSLFGVNTVV